MENMYTDVRVLRKKVLIVTEILLVSTLGNAERTVWRICILILECKGLSF